MLQAILECIELLHVGYRVKDEIDPLILNVFHFLKIEDKMDRQYFMHIDTILKKDVHTLTEPEIYTYLTYLFEKDKIVVNTLKNCVESGLFKELLLRYVRLQESDSLQCIKLTRDLRNQWQYARLYEEVMQKLTISSSGRVYLTRYIIETDGLKSLKTEQARIRVEDAQILLNEIQNMELCSKKIIENGWELKLYKNIGGKNRLVKTITGDDEMEKLNEKIRSMIPFDHVFGFGGSLYSWKK